MYSRILVPLDGSHTAERGLDEALKLCSGTAARLCLLHVIDAYAMLVELASIANSDQLMAQARKYGDGVLNAAKDKAAGAGIGADTSIVELTHGRISEAIIDEAARTGCDLIVMGSHGRRGVARMTLGSCAEQVLRSASVPVLLVRASQVPSIEGDF